MSAVKVVSKLFFYAMIEFLFSRIDECAFCVNRKEDLHLILLNK